MNSDADNRFHNVESELTTLHASALSELQILNIGFVDRSDRIGSRGDYPFINIEYRNSSPLPGPEIAMVTTRLEYSFPTDNAAVPMIRFETVSEIFQTGCESRLRKIATAMVSLDNIRTDGLATIVSRCIATGYAAIGVKA